MNRLLDHLLVSLEVRLEAFALLEVARNCRLSFDGLDAVIIHYILEGEGWLDTPGKPATAFRPGSIVILPARLSQSLRIDENPAKTMDAGEHCAMVKDGLIRFDATDGGQPQLRVLCGSLMPTVGGSFGLLDGLSQPLVETFDGVGLMSDVFAMLRSELASPTLGTRALAGSLMKLPLVVLIRLHLDRLSAGSPLMAGVSDERLIRAMASVIEGPAEGHTVASLAACAGMSRSAFARAFTHEFHQTPMEFVAKARLHHAAELLRGTDLPVKVIAASIGFASRSHFSRAFRRAYGDDPQAFRRGRAAAITAPRRLGGDREDYALASEPDDFQARDSA